MSKIETISLEMIRNVIRQYEKMMENHSNPDYLKNNLNFWKEKEKDFYKKTNSKNEKSD
jgi:hypothetical protein